MIQELTGEDLNTLIKETHDREFLIVDIRPDREYHLDHIPGAINMPAKEVEASAGTLFNNRKIIFYCRSGIRSKVAILFAMDAGYDPLKLFHLNGGMMAYSGEILMDLPQLDLFPSAQTPSEILKKAIELEKGAFIFYSRAKEIFKDTPIFVTFEQMEQAEINHATQIYNGLSAYDLKILPFEAMFKNSNGDILEGGKSLKEIEGILCIGTTHYGDIMDFAIELEYSAYDLYKTMAETMDDPSLKSMFFSLAQAEKKHMELLINASEWCDAMD